MTDGERLVTWALAWVAAYVVGSLALVWALSLEARPEVVATLGFIVVWLGTALVAFIWRVRK